MTELTDDGWDEPLTGLPLPPHATHILDSLLPMRGRSRRGYNRPPDTLAQAWYPASKANFRDWLGFEPPSLPSLIEDYGLSEYCVVVHPFSELPARRAIPPGANVTLSVLYVPADIDWTATGSHAAAVERGMVTVSLLTGYGAPWPPAAPPIWQVSTNEGSGDSVVVPVGSTRVGVQRRGVASTRLAWSASTPSPGFNVTVWAHLPPVVAVSALVKDWASTRLRPLPHPHR
jgi:hypothetical protein